jgi:hypothetical protein
MSLYVEAGALCVSTLIEHNAVTVTPQRALTPDTARSA